MLSPVLGYRIFLLEEGFGNQVLKTKHQLVSFERLLLNVLFMLLNTCNRINLVIHSFLLRGNPVVTTTTTVEAID